MKTLITTLVLAAALAGCAGTGSYQDPSVARDAGFMEHPGTAYAPDLPGSPPLQAGPVD